MTSQEDVTRFKASGSWRGLAKLAGQIVEDAESKGARSMAPVMGGGTRIMLAFEHRISDDIDLFIHDVQWIGYLTPRLNDAFEAEIDSYEESAASLKLHLSAGEIDFIVAPTLLPLSVERSPEVAFALEPVEEVLAKKLFYRGWCLAPRDLFDWHASAAHFEPGHLGRLLGPLLRGDKSEAISHALKQMRTSSAAAQTWEAIRAPDKPRLEHCIDWGLRELEAYAQCVPAPRPALNAELPPRG